MRGPFLDRNVRTQLLYKAQLLLCLNLPIAGKIPGSRQEGGTHQDAAGKEAAVKVGRQVPPQYPHSVLRPERLHVGQLL